MGEVNRHQKFETTKNEKTKKYTRPFISKHLKQANNAIIQCYNVIML